MPPDHHHNATASLHSIVIQSWLYPYSIMRITEYQQVRRMHHVQVLNRRIPKNQLNEPGHPIHLWLDRSRGFIVPVPLSRREMASPSLPSATLLAPHVKQIPSSYSSPLTSCC